jgi:hypothetical protein
MNLPENEQEKIALLMIEKLNEQKDNKTVDQVINLPEKHLISNDISAYTKVSESVFAQVWDNLEDEVYDNL